VRDISPTRSPAVTPEAIRPLASAETSVRNSRQVTSTQLTPTRRLKTTLFGASAALTTTRSVRLPVGVSITAGQAYSSIVATPRQRLTVLSD